MENEYFLVMEQDQMKASKSKLGIKTSLNEDDFEDFDDDYLAEIDNLNTNFTTDCDEDLAMQDYLIENACDSGDFNDDDYSKSLVPIEGEEDIDSDEEKDILKGIRDEIEIKVRDEMKEELELYKGKLLALEVRKTGETDDEKCNDDEVTGEEEEEMDPKLKEAFIKMRKLDRILMKKIRREKEVKRERILMEKRLRDEVSHMKHGAACFSEIRMNTEKFLSLSAPLSHNAGISLQDIESDLPPLFQTEIDDSEIKRRGKQDSEGDRSHGNSSQQTDCHERSTSENGESLDGSTASSEKNKKSKKDFIQRNKELAAASNEVVAMTDDEKERLQELLGDVDDMPELEDDLNDLSSVDFQLALSSGDGFMPDDNELKNLTYIDSKLKSVMADEDYKSVVGSSVRSTPRQPLFTKVGVGPALLDGFGERVLYETKEERELKARLQAIEQELDIFKAPKEMENDGTDFHLTDEQLDKLLDQCARSTSQMSVMETPDLSSRSNASSRQALMANPPKLSDEQLQQLLSEAHFPMSNQFMSLREAEEKFEDEDGRTEIIRAETWKAIVDESLDSNNVDSTESPTYNIDPHSNHVFSNRNDNYGEDDAQGNLSAFSEYNTNGKKHQYNMEDSHDVESSDHYSVVSSTTSLNAGISHSLPRIISSNTLPRQSSQSDAIRSDSISPTNLRESSNASLDSVRFPKISSNSFLIQAPQGLNNEPENIAMPTLTKQPIKMLHNNFAEMPLESFSEDERGLTDRRFHRTNSPAIPRPPPGSKPRDASKSDH